jgi:hypothetical protein
VPHEIAFRIELEDVRRGQATLAGRRCLGRTDLGARVEAVRQVEDEDVVA